MSHVRGPNPQFAGIYESDAWKKDAQQEWEKTQDVCRKTAYRKKNEKKNNNRKAVRLTKISLNAFNGAERAVCLRHTAPVKAPFGGFCSREYL